MRSILLKKDEYLADFAEAAYTLFQKRNLGIQLYCDIDYDLSLVRKELIGWECNEDNNALTDVSIQSMSWLPVTYSNLRTSLIGGSCTTGQSSDSCSISMSYPYASNTSQNIIEVNAGGCVTRINVNPLITVSTSSKFEFTQSSPSAVWLITHNLGFYPNVYTLNGSGQEIIGAVDPIDTNSLQIIFSNPQSGVAYLS